MRKRLARLFLLSGLLLWSCRDGHRQLTVRIPDKPSVPSFSYVYMDYGGPPEPDLSKAQAVVLQKYGLSYHGFGCVVTDSLIRAVHRHNDSLFALLQPPFPGLSEDRLRQEIQAVRSPKKY